MTRSEAVELVALAMNEDPQNMDEDTQLGSLNGWDSIGQLSVMAKVDSTFGKVLSPEQIAACQTTRELLELFCEHLEKPSDA